MNERKAKTVADHVTTVVLLVGILVFLNLGAEQSTVSKDFSGKGYMELQEPTRNVLDKIEDPITITYYVTDQLMPPTPQYQNLRDKVTALLRLYRSTTGPNMKLNVVNPAEGERRLSEDVRDEMSTQGVLSSFEEIERKGKTTSYRFISSIRMTYRDTTKVINRVHSVANLENQLTRDILYAHKPKLIRIGVYVPPKKSLSRSRRRGSRPQMTRSPDERSFTDLEEELRKVGPVKRIYLEKGEQFPDPRKEDTIDVLFVLANRKIPASDRFALDQFIMKGGSVVLGIDRMGRKPSMRGGMMMRRRSKERMGFIQSGFEDALEGYGLSASSKILIAPTDVKLTRYKMVTKKVGGREIGVRKPVKRSVPIVFLARPELGSKNTPPFVRRTSGLMTMIARSVKPSDEKSDDVKYTPWFGTEEFGVELEPSGTGPRAVNEFRSNIFGFTFGDIPEEQKAKHHLAAHLEGSFSTFYDSRDKIPESFRPSGSDNGGGAEGSPNNGKEEGEKTKPWPAENGPEVVKKVEDNDLVVFGDTDLFSIKQMGGIYNNFIKKEQDLPNRKFVQNLAEYLGKNPEELKNLKSEKTVTPKLKDLNEGQKFVYQTVMLGLSPFLVVLLGLVRWVLLTIRRKETKIQEEE